MIFRFGIKCTGSFTCSFCFETQEQAEVWKHKQLPKIRSKYGNVNIREFPLPGLEVGDQCNVYGEGDQKFQITGITQFQTNRFGFRLNSGWVEEVCKCHTNFL